MVATLLLAGCLLCGQAADEPASRDTPANAPAAPGDAAAAPNGAPGAPGDEDRELAAQVRRLVRQLDSNELADRDAAERALIELGPPVLDKLPRVTARTPAEVKARLERVAKAVQQAAAEAVGEASRVTLQGEMTLTEAMESLRRQTGNVVVGHEGRQATIQAEFDDVPYWEALDQILDQAQLTINPYGGKAGALTVEARPESRSLRYGSASYVGPFRFEPLRVQAQRGLRNPATTGMRVTVEVSWEPRLVPISLAVPLADVTAKDEDDVSLAVSGRGTPSFPVNADISAIEIDIPLELPPREVETIGRLKGRLLTVLPGRVEAFEFGDLAQANNVQQQRASATVTFEKLRKNEDLFEARMRLRYEDAANALESHRGWVYNNDAFLLDAEGQRVDHAGLQATRQELNEIGLAYLFTVEDPGKYKFIYRTPVAILKSDVEFELRDIPLP